MSTEASFHYSNMDKNEIVYAEFIKDKIQRSGGQIKFQHITGHLLQLDLKIRETIGTSPLDLRKFLKKHSQLFSVDEQGFVSDQKASVPATNTNANSDISEYSNDPESLFPSLIKEAQGIVIKVLPTFGFIALKKPVKTSVYFTPACVVDRNTNKEGKAELLTDFPDMLPGKKVLINAKKANTSLETKYRATKVWTPPNVKDEVLAPDGFKPKVPKDSLFNPINIEGSGKVQKVFPQFGFITDSNTSESIFFHKLKLQNFQNITDLAKVLSVNDIVEFKAMRSTKKEKVKWEATKVWIKKQGKSNLFKADFSGSEVAPQQQKNSSESPEKLLSESGKIYSHSDGVVIRFGKHDAQLADADSCPFYMKGMRVEDVSWEFSDGDCVNFDAMKIKSAPGWKAMLAWVGDRPNVIIRPSDFEDFSDNEPVPLPKITAPAKIRSVQEFDHPRQNIYTESAEVFKRPNSSALSQSSVDKDFDLHSEDTVSTVSEEYKPQITTRNRRRRKKGGHRSHDSVHKVSSYTSLTDDTAFESEDDSSRNINVMEFHNSNFGEDKKDLDNLSQPSLKSYSSLDSLEIRNRLKPNPELFKSWGDTPFPGEEIEMLQEDRNPANIDDKQSLNDFKMSPVKMKPVGKSSVQVKSLQKLFLSDDEFSDAVEDIESTKTQSCELAEDGNAATNNIKDTDSAFANIMNSTEVVKESKPTASVICFSDLEGNVLKVFCKYAEIESSRLSRCISVLSNNVYFNGVLLADKYQDMKEVIKVGQAIQFNCFEIIDDDGGFWHKVTSAWVGKKPKKTDMTPQDYICNSALKVSIDESDYVYVNKMVDVPEAKVPLDIPVQNHAEVKLPPNVPVTTHTELPPPPRKFLTTTSPTGDEDDNEPASSSSDNEHSDCLHSTTEKESLSEEIFMPPINEADDLTEVVEQMISSFNGCEVDRRALSSNIINLVWSKMLALKSLEPPIKISVDNDSCLTTSFKKSEKSNESLSEVMKKEMANSETQTIITGDVIAQSIFTL